MTTGSANDSPAPAPVLVLGLGNPLLADDGVGLVLLARLQSITELESVLRWLEVSNVTVGEQMTALGANVDGMLLWVS